MLVKLGLIQTACRLSKEESLRLLISNIRLCAQQGAQIICTQELCLHPYFCSKEDSSSFLLAESIPGPTTESLQNLAAELEITLILSLFEKRMSGLYHNSAAILDADGSLLGLYRKMHIPDDPDYYEKYYFSPGDLGYPVWNTRYGRLGVLICWDQWFPEAARIMALQGAQMIFYPTAIGWQDHEYEQEGEKQHQAWENIQRSHAIANGIFLCASNRTGREGNIRFWGQSFVCDPFGRIIQKAGAEEEENIVCEIDTAEIDKSRQAWPFLRDRRIDSYEPLLRMAIP